MTNIEALVKFVMDWSSSERAVQVAIERYGNEMRNEGYDEGYRDAWDS